MQKYKLGEIASVTAGQSAPQGAVFSKRGIPFIRAGSLADLLNGKSENDFELLSKGVAEKHKLKMQPQGTILFAKSGMSCMKGYVYELQQPCYVVSHLACVKPNDKVKSKYIKHFFGFNKPNKLVKDESYPSISLDDIKNIEICLPPLPEQERIAGELDTVCGVITKQKEQYRLFDELIKSKFNKMFGGYFDNKETYKSLKKICDFIDYRGKTPKKSDFGIPLVTAKNLKGNKFSIEPQEFIPAENYNDIMTRGIPKINDVLFTTEAPLGNVCRIPNLYKKFCVGQRLITMQPKETILTSEYLEIALLSRQFQEEMWRQSSGSTVKGIRSKLLVEIQIPVPGFAEQKYFSRYVQQVDKLKIEVQKSLDETETLYKALMQKYFG